MSGLLDLMARLFVAPPDEVPPRPTEDEEVRWLPPVAVTSPRDAPDPPGPVGAEQAQRRGRGAGVDPGVRLAVLCALRDSAVAGGAAGLALAHAARGPTVIVAVWTGEAPASRANRPGTPAARRVAAALRAGGHDAAALGRLVRVGLPVREGDAVAAARMVIGRASGPTALVVCGPRGADFEGLLAEQDLALVAVRGDLAAELGTTAVAELGCLRVPVAVVTLAASTGCAALARSGIGLLPPLRPALLAAVEPLTARKRATR